MNNTTLSKDIQTVQFHSQNLTTFEQNGTYYTAMKPICENIRFSVGISINSHKT